MYIVLSKTVLPEVLMWNILSKTFATNHMDIEWSSQQVTPDDGDIRRRNKYRETLLDNNKGKCISWYFYVYAAKCMVITI
jgi:hypothetical protein